MVLVDGHGVACAWDGGNRYTVWSLHPSGRWVENLVRRGPAGPDHAVDGFAASLVAQQLSGRNQPVTINPTQQDRWRSDEDFLHQPPGLEVKSHTTVRGDGWGPAAAERLVEAGWEAEAAARDTRPRRSAPVVLPSQKRMAAVRDADYGHPRPNFTTTGAYWQQHVRAKHGVDVPFDVDDVAVMNVLQKLSRQAYGPKPDNWDDVSGFADTAVMASTGPVGDA